MKTKLVLIAAMFTALVSSAQTNSIIFPQLLSPTNSVLMTNAEFRTFSGNKIIFKNDSGYKSFTAADLNTNVLGTLGTSTEKLNAQQAKLDAANKKFRSDYAVAAAEQQHKNEVQMKKDAAYKAAGDNFILGWQLNHGGQSPTEEQIRLDMPVPK